MIMESLRQREGHLWLSCFSTWRLSSFIFVHDWETLMRIASLVVWFPTPVLSVITATLVSQVDFPVWVTFDGMSFRCSLLSAVTLACCYSTVVYTYNVKDWINECGLTCCEAVRYPVTDIVRKTWRASCYLFLPGLLLKRFRREKHRLQKSIQNERMCFQLHLQSPGKTRLDALKTLMTWEAWEETNQALIEEFASTFFLCSHLWVETTSSSNTCLWPNSVNVCFATCFTSSS